MFRVILFLIGFLIVISLIRSVLGILSKFTAGLFGTLSQPDSTPGSRAPSAPAPTTGELRKDPVCGTFISTATAFQKAIKGETYYFCSTQCRDKFKG
jgi:YHS domain-containing protein